MTNCVICSKKITGEKKDQVFAVLRRWISDNSSLIASQAVLKKAVADNGHLCQTCSRDLRKASIPVISLTKIWARAKAEAEDAKAKLKDLQPSEGSEPGKGDCGYCHKPAPSGRFTLRYDWANKNVALIKSEGGVLKVAADRKDYICEDCAVLGRTAYDARHFKLKSREEKMSENLKKLEKRFSKNS